VALVLVGLAIPASASAQATRTWVSGVGDDANPCSRTAPCKTFAGAISKTANGGEINCLDPGGFGGVTINKSLAIKCQYTEGGVLVAGTNGIVINAAATDKVTLRGLDINGTGSGVPPVSLTGVKVLSAAKVNIVDSEIYSFKDGVAVMPTSPSTRVMIVRSHIHTNGVGVFTGPGSNAATFTSSTIRYSDIQDNTCGISSSAFGSNGSTPDANTDCGAGTTGTGINQVVGTRVIHNGINDNGTGVFGRGTNSTTDIAYNDITGNSTFGLHRIESAAIRSTSPATNVLLNAVSDAPSSTVPLGKRHAKRFGTAGAKLHAKRLW
jgi:hypothetical protein